MRYINYLDMIETDFLHNYSWLLEFFHIAFKPEQQIPKKFIFKRLKSETVVK